ncbi:MAG: glycosyl hydrolase [Candidatus Krumholzibacteriia bacterium]
MRATLPRFLPAAAGLLLLTLSVGLAPAPAAAADDAPWAAGDFAGLSWRALGPAIASGRVGDLAIDPRDPFHWYVAVSSGGVWETTNNGVTLAPIFDGEGSYSIGCLALAPSAPDVVWVGTGENNSQRSVSWGDGVYRSLDGGKSWRNMGLKSSRHIGRIVIHPADPDIVWVAAMGPLWGPGGDRGVYKTVDGGENWELVLEIDENTGVVDLVPDPRDPDVLYAASYQRRRHVWTLINGGPGSGIHKTTDGGRTWTALTSGLPKVDIGRIGLAVAPKAPDTVYAIVEAAQGKGGFFRSTNGGISWEKRSDYVAGSPQYYNEIIPDPVDPDRLYSMDTFLRTTADGGKTWERLSVKRKHVDDHALWIDPARTEHLLVGCDGGVYESFDRGRTWRFFTNLPVTQFYRVAVDYDEPFYNVYGGTQDNNTIGGPSRTRFSYGAANRDWYFTLGGDGFEPACDPTNPDIVYCQWQHGNLVRWDRRTGETVDIQPQPEAGEILKWNWDSPVIISPHDHRRLYFASQKVFRSDNRGQDWSRVSGDLSRGLDRNTLKVMGRVWSVDAVAKNNSTSFWGNIVALAESPVTEHLLYAGTDDGLIHVTRDAGGAWTRLEDFKGVPAQSYVADVEPDRFEAGTVYAAFDNHKRDDFRPYVLKSTDYGKSWKSIAGDLPDNGPVYSLVQDHVDPRLLFVGTEFGVFFTRDGGARWTQLKAGMPTIACRDLEIQRRENDLVVATFGRGFYVLDDYTPLRNLEPAVLDAPATIFPVREALIYVPWSPAGVGHQGDDFWTAENPPFGAVVTYHLEEGLQTLEDQRREQEQKLAEAGEDTPYPSWDELRAEDREFDPAVVLTVRDAAGRVVRQLDGPTGKGFHRVAWDLRYPPTDPVQVRSAGERSPWDSDPVGPLAAPGTYSVTLSQRLRGTETVLAGPVEFTTRLLGGCVLPAEDIGATVAFGREAADLHRAVAGAGRLLREAEERLDHLRLAVDRTPGLERGLHDRVDAMVARVHDLRTALGGDRTVEGRSEPATPGISERVGRVVWGSRETTGDPTGTHRRSLAVARELFAPVLADLARLVEEDLPAIEAELEAAGAPWTPGRVPQLR